MGKEHSLTTVEGDKREQCVRAPSPQMYREREAETVRGKGEGERKREEKLKSKKELGVSVGYPSL